MDGPGDQLLARPGFAEDQHRGVGGRHGLHLAQRLAESRAVADDLAEVALAADLILEVQLLFGQLVFQPLDFAKRLRVLDGNGRLRRHLREKIDILGREGVLADAGQIHRTQYAVARGQRDANARAQTFALQLASHCR